MMTFNVRKRFKKLKALNIGRNGQMCVKAQELIRTHAYPAYLIVDIDNSKIAKFPCITHQKKIDYFLFR